MHAASYATSAEMAAEVGPFPRFEANREAMLRVVRNHRRAAYNAPTERIRRADHPARRHRRALLPRLSARGRPPRVATGWWSWARSTATAMPRSRASRRPAPSPWSWIATPPASSPTSPWSSSRSWPAAATSRSSTPPSRPPSPGSATRREQIEDIVRYCRGAGTLHGCPHINPASLRAKGFPDDVLQRIEAQLPGVFELPFAFNRWTVGDDVLHEQPRLHAGADRGAGLRPADRPRLHPAADRRGQRLRLRHHDHRRGAAPQAGASSRSSTAPTSAASSASASCRPSRTSA